MSLVNRPWSEELVSEIKKEDTLEIIEENNEIEKTEKPWFSLWTKIKLLFGVIIVIWVVWSIWSWMYSNARTIMIDNPTGSGITLKIDTWEEISLNPNTSKTVKITSWEHIVYINWKEVWKFEKSFTDSNMFLNPTESIYIEEYILYLEDQNDTSYDDKLPNSKIEAYWNTTEWPFKKYEWLVIKGNWDYGIDEKIPEKVSLGKRKKYKIVQKLYRFDDFVDMYNEVYIGNSEVQEVVQDTQ